MGFRREQIVGVSIGKDRAAQAVRFFLVLWVSLTVHHRPHRGDRAALCLPAIASQVGHLGSGQGRGYRASPAAHQFTGQGAKIFEDEIGAYGAALRHLQTGLSGEHQNAEHVCAESGCNIRIEPVAHNSDLLRGETELLRGDLYDFTIGVCR